MSDTENRETWQARLWAANDEYLYDMTRDQDAETIRDVFEEILSGEGYGENRAVGVLGDVIGLWLDRVDWDAVADAQRDEDIVRCGICDETESLSDLPADWNGDTGCHISCEDAE